MVRIGRNFFGVDPLRRPAGDAGYFCGDSHADVIMLRRFAGVPGVFDDVRFCGDAGTVDPHLSSLGQSLLERASCDSLVCNKHKQDKTQRHKHNIM